MKKSDILSGTLGVIIGIVFCVGSYRLGLGRLGKPESGFLPFLVGGILFCLSITILIRGMAKEKQNIEKTERGGKKFGKVFLILLSLVFYNIALDYIGFGVTTFLFLIFLMRFIEGQRWVKTLLTAFLVSLVSCTVFQAWLKLGIPEGPWGF